MTLSNVTKSVLAVGAVGLAIATFAPLVGAQTVLSTTCAGAVTTSSIAWSSSVTGGVSPYAYLWSGTGLTGATSSAITASYSPGTYAATLAVTDASSTVATTTCMATVSPTATTTTQHFQRFHKSPMLQINPGGHFLARGMTVTSVGVDSFTGTIWGTTWTVRFRQRGNEDHEFLTRDGRSTNVFDFSSVRVDDEVGVSGRVDPVLPLTVNAQVIRDYSLLPTPRVLKERHNEQGEDGRGKGPKTSTTTTSNVGRGNENEH